jgi:type IV pilus assembly protein PilX
MMFRATASFARMRPTAAKQQGIVVFVALIAVVLMSLAAVGLMRSVHTSTIVVGNLAFRQAAQSMASAAVEKAVYDMFQPGTIASPDNHDLNKNYYAFVQPGENAMGVPASLQSVGAYPGTFQSMTDTSGNTARYVIERMCRDPGGALPNPPGLPFVADGRWCEMIPPKQGIGFQGNIERNIGLDPVPYYRMTVRVDGPNNSVSFAQAMLR